MFGSHFQEARLLSDLYPYTEETAVADCALEGMGLRPAAVEWEGWNRIGEWGNWDAESIN